MRFVRFLIIFVFVYSVSCNSSKIKKKQDRAESIPSSYNIPNVAVYKKDYKSPFVRYANKYEYRLKKKVFKLNDLLSGYKDEKLNRKYLRTLARMYPKVTRYYHIGRSQADRPIPALRITSSIGKMENKVAILFNGAHHANELLSTEHCYDILYHILNDYQKYQKYLRHVVIWFVPIVNPDGSHSFWHKSIGSGRKNAYKGVDLNRNYPFQWNSGIPKASSSERSSPYYRGSSPASELETKAMMKLARTQRFVASISFHQYASKILYPYTIPNLKNPTPDYAKSLAIELAKLVTIYHDNKKFLPLKNIYAVDGTDQDYFYHKYNTLAYILESTHHNIHYKHIRTIMNGFRPLWTSLIHTVVFGNKIFLKFKDSDSEKPVSARVNIKEIQFFENEKPRSNPKNGLFYWLVEEEKVYNLKVFKDGYYPRYIKYKASSSPKPKLVYLNKRTF